MDHHHLDHGPSFYIVSSAVGAAKRERERERERDFSNDDDIQCTPRRTTGSRDNPRPSCRAKKKKKKEGELVFGSKARSPLTYMWTFCNLASTNIHRHVVRAIASK